MSSFFESDIVRESMSEMEEMQKKILMHVFDLPYLTNKEKKDYIDLIREFLEKQRILFFRMSLSDDPEAQEIKKQILESIEILGFTKNQDINEFFSSMENSIIEIEKSLGVS